MQCHKCKQNIFDLVRRGAYLKRTSPKGEAFVGECSPSCEGDYGDQDDALIRAIEDDKEVK